MILMPGEVKGKAWKLARPFHGPYRILSLTSNNAEVVLVDRPTRSLFPWTVSDFVTQNWKMMCPGLDLGKGRETAGSVKL